MKFLFIGDVVGQAGQVVFEKHIARLREKHAVDAVIVNGENAANNGKGIRKKQLNFYKQLGVNVITSGNHIWDQRDSYPLLDEMSDFVIRPANYPSDCPGKGYALIDVQGTQVAIVNLQGRVFMHSDLDCPFRTIESLLTMLKTKTKIIFVDFHAEATSEKQALAFFLDGKISGIFGTHTHVPTADEMILPKGTAYTSDLGFCGAVYSCLGIKKEIIIKKFLTQMPQRFEVEKEGPFALNGVVVTVDLLSGKATSIERIRLVDSQISAGEDEVK